MTVAQAQVSKVLRRYPVTILLGGQYAAFAVYPAIEHHTQPFSLIIRICLAATFAAFIVETFAPRRPFKRRVSRGEPRQVTIAATWWILSIGVAADIAAYLTGSGSYAVQVGQASRSTLTAVFTPLRYWELFGAVLIIWAYRQGQIRKRRALLVLGIVCLVRLYIGVATAILASGIMFIGCLVVLSVIMGLIRLRTFIIALIIIPVVWPTIYRLRNETRSQILGAGQANTQTASDRLRMDVEMATLTELAPKPRSLTSPSALYLVRYGLLPSFIDRGRPDVNIGSEFSVALGGSPTNSRTATLLGNAYIFGGWLLVVLVPAGLALTMRIAIRRDTPWGYMFVGLIWLYGISVSANWPLAVSSILQGAESMVLMAIVSLWLPSTVRRREALRDVPAPVAAGQRPKYSDGIIPVAREELDPAMRRALGII